MLLYIHIPFCDSKCFYCSFNSYTDKFNLKKNYIEALKKQLKNNLIKYAKNEKIETVFIGGGTPSTIKTKHYEEIFEIFKPYLQKNAEITSEANPNSANKEWLKEMKDLGVNRISFGVQSFQDEKLKFLGRNHKAINAVNAIQNAFNVGFNYINCDIIYGVKYDTIKKIKYDLDIAFSLPINHISAYSLTIEEGTKFFELDKRSVQIDDEELSYEIFDYMIQNGYRQYEISNFAKNEQSESKHNYGYWQHKEYLGIGAGAVGYVNNQRKYTHKILEKYIQNPLFEEIELLSSEDIKTEKVLLGLRSSNGVNISVFNSKELLKIKDLESLDKICIINNTIYNKNFLLSDELALFILD